MCKIDRRSCSEHVLVMLDNVQKRNVVVVKRDVTCPSELSSTVCMLYFTLARSFCFVGESV